LWISGCAHALGFGKKNRRIKRYLNHISSHTKDPTIKYLPGSLPGDGESTVSSFFSMSILVLNMLSVVSSWTHLFTESILLYLHINYTIYIL